MNNLFTYAVQAQKLVMLSRVVVKVKFDNIHFRLIVESPLIEELNEHTNAIRRLATASDDLLMMAIKRNEEILENLQTSLNSYIAAKLEDGFFDEFKNSFMNDAILEEINHKLEKEYWNDVEKKVVV